MAPKTTTVRCPKRHDVEVLTASLHDDRPTTVKCNHTKKDGSLCGEVFEAPAQADDD